MFEMFEETFASLGEPFGFGCDAANSWNSKHQADTAKLLRPLPVATVYDPPKLNMSSLFSQIVHYL